MQSKTTNTHIKKNIMVAILADKLVKALDSSTTWFHYCSGTVGAALLISPMINILHFIYYCVCGVLRRGMLETACSFIV